MKLYPDQPTQPTTQKPKIYQKFKYLLPGQAIASNEDMAQVGYCLGLKYSARPRECTSGSHPVLVPLLSNSVSCW